MASGKHVEITDLIIKAFYIVYNTLGYGFAEKVYKNALTIELHKMGLIVEVEYPITVYYNGQPVGVFAADLFVAGCVLVELKAIKELIDENEAITQLFACNDTRGGSVTKFRSRTSNQTQKL